MCSEVSICIVTCLLALYVKYLLELSCKAKDAQVAISLLTTCNNLLQQADIRIRSHGLRQLVDDNSAVNCQQTCCKLLENIKTCCLQVY